jgi:hypothetical protein
MNLDRFGPYAKGAVSLLVILSFIGMIAALLWMSFRDKDFPPGIKETLLILVGVLAGEFKNVCQYWLGSSHGSFVKNEALLSAPPPNHGGQGA